MRRLNPIYVNLSLRLLSLLITYDIIQRYSYTSNFTLLHTNINRSSEDHAHNNITTTTTDHLCTLPTTAPTTNTTAVKLFSTLRKPFRHPDLLNTYFTHNLGLQFTWLPRFKEEYTELNSTNIEFLLFLGVLSNLWCFFTGRKDFLILSFLVLLIFLQNESYGRNHHADQYLCSILAIHTLHWITKLSKLSELKKKKMDLCRDSLLLFTTTHVYLTTALLKMNSNLWGTCTTIFNNLFSNQCIVDRNNWGNALLHILYVDEFRTDLVQFFHPSDRWIEGGGALLRWLSPAVVLLELYSAYLLFTLRYYSDQKGRPIKEVRSGLLLRECCWCAWVNLGVVLCAVFHLCLLVLFRFGVTFHLSFLFSLLPFIQKTLKIQKNNNDQNKTKKHSPENNTLPKSTSKRWLNGCAFLVLCLHLSSHYFLSIHFQMQQESNDRTPRPPSMPTNDNLDLNQSAKDLNFDIDSDSSAHHHHHPPHWMKWIPLIQPWHMFAPKPFDLDLNLYIHLYQDQDHADHAAWEEEEVSSMNHLVEIYPRPRHPRDFSALISLLSMTVKQRHVFLRAAAQRVHTQLNCLSSRLVGSSSGRNIVVRRCPDVQEEFFVGYEVLLVVHQNVFIYSDFLRKRKIKGKTTKRMCEAVVLKRDVLDSNDGSMY